MSTIPVDRQGVRAIVFVDAVEFSAQLKRHGRESIAPKIRQLRDFVEFCFVFRLKGQIVNEMGDGFLILCPPKPAEVIREAVACQALIAAHNHGRPEVQRLAYRIALHYGLVSPPEGSNYVDTSINLAARLQGVAPRNSVCISSVLHDIVADTLTSYSFAPSRRKLKGFGVSVFYVLESPLEPGPAELSKRETRLGFYLSTIEALQEAESHQAIRAVCEEGLRDFPNHPELTFQGAFAALLMDDKTSAIHGFERCVELEYNVSHAYHFLGELYEDLGDQQRAEDMLRRAIDNDPRHFHAMLSLGELNLKRRELEAARSWGNRASRLAPRFFSPLALLAALGLSGVGRVPAAATLRRIPPENISAFRKDVERYLGVLGSPRYRRKLDLLCETVEMRRKSKMDERRPTRG